MHESEQYCSTIRPDISHSRGRLILKPIRFASSVYSNAQPLVRTLSIMSVARSELSTAAVLERSDKLMIILALVLLDYYTSFQAVG